MDKKRLLELAGVQLNEQHDPNQTFVGYSLEREDIATLINSYVLGIDEDSGERDEEFQGVAAFTPDDERLTDEACKKFVSEVVDWAMESAMGDRAHETIEGATNYALPKFMRRLRLAGKRRQGE